MAKKKNRSRRQKNEAPPRMPTDDGLPAAPADACDGAAVEWDWETLSRPRAGVGGLRASSGVQVSFSTEGKAGKERKFLYIRIGADVLDRWIAHPGERVLIGMDRAAPSRLGVRPSGSNEGRALNKVGRKGMVKLPMDAFPFQWTASARHPVDVSFEVATGTDDNDTLILDATDALVAAGMTLPAKGEVGS